jgi:hypothetical protein
MTRLRHCLAVGLLLAGTAVAHAADEKGRFAVKGPGLATCKDFTEATEQKSQNFYVMGGWLLGFITAHNLHMKETYDAASWQSGELLVGLMENYCKQRPDDRFAEGTIKLVRVLMQTRLTEESKLVVAQHGDNKVAVYEEVMRRAQEEMKKQGYYTGVIDGLYGPGTRTAFEALQAANKIPVTGVPDARTLFTLFRDDLKQKQAEQ